MTQAPAQSVLERPKPLDDHSANPETPIRIEDLRHRYGEREALTGVSLTVGCGEIFGLLGPNGGGKTTLFRILCTSMAPAGGSARICGLDVGADAARVRRLIGVVFQSASLDRKLTVRENLWHQGHLYGMFSRMLNERIECMLDRFSLADRANDRVETLSGGLARRADLARGLLHQPRVLLLDEPSTGLDPHARWEFWQHLDTCRREEGLTVLLTTHYMAEADRCDRVGIIDAGRLVAVGTPDELKRTIRGECLTVQAADATQLAEQIARKFELKSSVLDGRLRIERERAHELIGPLVEAFGEQIEAVSLSKPTLEEVFIHHTGRRFEEVS